MEKSDATLARIFDDPSFPLFSIGNMSDSSAGDACVEHFCGVFRHEAPVNVGVFLHEFLYTIPQSAHYKNYEYLSAGRSVVRKRYQVVTSLFDVDCL